MTLRSPYKVSEVRAALDQHRAHLAALIKERDTRWAYFYSLCVQKEDGVALNLARLRWEIAHDSAAGLEKRIHEYEQRQRDALTPVIIRFRSPSEWGKEKCND